MMFVSCVSIDDQETGKEIEYRSSDVTPELVEQLIQRLDGSRHTLVVLAHNGEAHVAVGGDARVGLIVYCTEDNDQFRNLLSATPEDTTAVQLVAGGQLGDYERRFVVSASVACQAAVEYAESGHLAKHLAWDATD